MTEISQPLQAALVQACSALGANPSDAVVLRVAENAHWRLPGGVIVRISRPGQWTAATREVHVARWLAASAVRAVEPLAIEQPVEANGRPATFWAEIPEHEHGTIADVAEVLRTLHALPEPDFGLGGLDPFVRIAERLQAATSLPAGDRQWLLSLHRDLAEAWPASLAASTAITPVHGDAWPGNIVRTPAGPLLMDLERFSIGPREWDLTSTAVRARTTGAVTASEYAEFCELYGYDVTTWNGFDILAGARELRMVSYAAQHAVHHPEWAREAQHRVDCLRGRHGDRPWKWTGIV
ncbi:aminoglycoside phosphotransferase family protein [Kitasatospora purpeofusca]|uniref:aminoglycoside phosphotransferase family protein n=1 Tax=Kitasatospora purpeofusca TaxID=67352 RepID=UPI00368A6D34